MSRQRRARYTATVTRPEPGHDIEKRVILGYGMQSVVDHYNERGYIVLGVEKGDYRAKERVATRKAQGGFRINRSALNDAIGLLDLKLPVDIRFHARVGNTNGSYRFERNGRHKIMLKSYLTPEQASSTLWHELTHAMQVERSGATYEAWAADLAKSKGKYQRCPREIEARKMSRDMADCPLTLPVVG